MEDGQSCHGFCWELGARVCGWQLAWPGSEPSHRGSRWLWLNGDTLGPCNDTPHEKETHTRHGFLPTSHKYVRCAWAGAAGGLRGLSSGSGARPSSPVGGLGLGAAQRTNR
eukprot:scaffold21372_cov129-Isochrysis_galbana.AAC.2